MKDRKELSSRLSAAVEATGILWRQRFAEFTQESEGEAHIINAEIEHLPIGQRNGRFYGRFFPLLEKLAMLFVETYRRYFKVALANPQECGPDSHEWAWNQLRAGTGPAFEWIQDWFALACDGENRYARHTVSIPFVPGETGSIFVAMATPPVLEAKSWCAPCWTFLVSPLMGIVRLREENVPDTQSDERLSAAHTRLLFKGNRTLFLRKLEAEIETARNEEIAAAGAVPASRVSEDAKKGNRPIEKRRPKGFEGLGEKKSFLSEYTDGLTEKQQIAFSLKFEYGLGVAEIATRMELDRKTVYEHLEAVDRKLKHSFSNAKRRVQGAKDSSE